MIYDSEIIDSLSARPPLSRRGPLNDSSGFAVEAVASGDRLRGFCGESRATLRRIHNASAAAAADDGTRLARSLARSGANKRDDLFCRLPISPTIRILSKPNCRERG